MPATPIYALPYPAPADPADVPLDFQELAERIEAVFTPLYAEVAPEESTTSASPVDLATVGPAITVPKAGTYIALAGVGRYFMNAAGEGRLYVKVGAAAAIELCSASIVNLFLPMGAAPFRITVGAAGTVVKLQYSVSTGTALFKARRLALIPLAVS